MNPYTRPLIVPSGIGIFDERSRQMQRQVVRQYFQLSGKVANVYLYQGSRDSTEPHIDDIQSKVFFEVPDRAYATDAVQIKILMDPIRENPMDFSRFGILNPISDEYTIRVHVDDMKCFGRTLIVPDVIEVPWYAKGCEALALFEITDVDDKPSYDKFYYICRMVPINDSRKTRELQVDGRSNTGIMEDIMMDMEADAEAHLPYQNLDPVQTPVDFRNKTQRTFIDDDDFIFDDET